MCKNLISAGINYLMSINFFFVGVSPMMVIMSCPEKIIKKKIPCFIFKKKEDQSTSLFLSFSFLAFLQIDGIKKNNKYFSFSYSCHIMFKLGECFVKKEYYQPVIPEKEVRIILQSVLYYEKKSKEKKINILIHINNKKEYVRLNNKYIFPFVFILFLIQYIKQQKEKKMTAIIIMMIVLLVDYHVNNYH